jgi:ferredoxin-NADP reductase
MSTYEAKLQGREEIAQGTMAFHFEKPAGFIFKPGQAIELVLHDTPGLVAGSARHTFSVVSAPFQDELVVATRMRDSAYKRALGVLPIGTQARLEGPSGSLTLHSDRARPALFMAGGIGITPFMSILRQAAKDSSPQQMVLLYSNRRPEDAAFLAELQKLAEQQQNFRLVATMTGMRKSQQAWDGETRPIDEALVRRICAELAAPICYLAGPPAMVEAVRESLGDAGVSDDDIRSEEFYGY